MKKKKFGNYPFDKGIYKRMYQDKLWTMRQYSGFSSTEESNKRYLEIIQNGGTGLSVAFDLPTQMGYDSDHEMAFGEVGKSGVPISTIEDMEAIFDKINLEKISVSMTINSTAAILLAFYIAVAKKKNFSLAKLRGTLQNDILKEYIARGTFIYPINHSLRITSDIFKYCQKNVPQFNPISISGYHIREAGSTAIQELAFTFSNAITYMEIAKQNKIDLKQLAKKFSFFFNSHKDFFEEVAKFRAARIIWAKIIKEHFGIDDIEAQLCRFHVQTGGSTLTAQQIDNNITRTSLQCLAAVLGGAQSIHTNAKDEAISLPSKENALTALKIQQIIAYETGITNYVDPVGDSSLVSDLTKNIVKETNKKINEIIKKGGTINCIETGIIQKEIEESAIKYQSQIEDKEKIIVGVNAFEAELENHASVSSKHQDNLNRIKELKLFKEKRNLGKVNQSLEDLKKTSLSNKNLMESLILCVENLCTLGEISDVLRDTFGVFEI